MSVSMADTAGLQIVDWARGTVGSGASELAVDHGARPTPMHGTTATGAGLVSNGRLGADLIRVPAQGGFSPHTHPGDHILIIVAGLGTITFGGQVHPTRPGQIYMVEGMVPHAVGAITDHVIIAVGSPHRAVDSADRMALVEYAEVLSPGGDFACLVCGTTVTAPGYLHDAGCGHCPCRRCVEGSPPGPPDLAERL